MHGNLVNTHRGGLPLLDEIKKITERVRTRCEEQACYNMPPEVLEGFIEFTYLMKLALPLEKIIEIDHAITSASLKGRLM
jgi:hypothetical protein